MDHTRSRGTKCIDAITVTPILRKHTEGGRLFETNEIANNYHQSYVVDMCLQEYFQEEFSRWDKIERGILDPKNECTEKKIMSPWMKY